MNKHEFYLCHTLPPKSYRKELPGKSVIFFKNDHRVPPYRLWRHPNDGKIKRNYEGDEICLYKLFPVCLARSMNF